MTDEEALLALCRTDFATFVQRAYIELYPNKEVTWNWHLDVMISDLQAMRRGDSLRKLILVPPRSLKSFICSVAWPAFLLGHQPDIKIIAVSYSQALADDLAQLCYDLMTSEWYKSVFATRFVRKKQPIDHLRTTRRGHRIATSIGGTLTGRGADLIIVDDPMKAEDAHSEAIRASTQLWFSETLTSRLDEKATGQILVVMQRLHPDDPASFLMERGWPALTLPAIAPDDLRFSYKTVFGTKIKNWKKGEPLQTLREPLHVLDMVRREKGSSAFSAQYLLDPEPAAGNLIKREWLRRYRAGDLPAFVRIIQSWDTASKQSELNDFSVCTTWGVTADRHYYLLDVYRDRPDHPGLVKAAISLQVRHGAHVILVEDKVSGTGMIQDLRAKGIAGVQGVKPENDKVMRLVSASTLFESGRVLLPDWAPWLDEYIRELVTFPGKFDDQVDSTSQALLWLRTTGAEPSIMTVYRQDFEEMRRQTSEAQGCRNVAWVTIRSPDGRSGRLHPQGSLVSYDTDEEGFAKLPGHMAAEFIANGWVVYRDS